MLKGKSDLLPPCSLPHPASSAWRPQSESIHQLYGNSDYGVITPLMPNKHLTHSDNRVVIYQSG